MAIEIECSNCSYGWSVPTAKAGKTVHCPECDEIETVPRPKRESSESGEFDRIRAGHRPQTDNSIVGTSVLIGGAVLVLGIGGLIGMRVMGLMQTENLNFDPEAAVARVTNSDGNQPEKAAGDVRASPTDSGDSETTQPNEQLTTDNGAAAETSPTATQELTPAQKRERFYLSLKEVAISVVPLPEDQRGAVRNTIEIATEGAMKRCGINTNEDASATMTIELRLDGDDDLRRVFMTATLTEDDSADAFIAWKRTSGVGVISDRAFATGVVPARLEKDISSFFTELRETIIETRRNNES